MKRITVLGSGLVGGIMARDLASDGNILVRSVDASQKNLSKLEGIDRIELRQADLTAEAALLDAIADADAVVGAVPGWMGQAMLRTVITAGKPISDISFAPEDPLELDGLAREKGVTAIVDCGVSPGLSALAIGRAASKLARTDTAVIYVGGLPVERYWPFEYRSVFSPTDVIEEYTRPSRLVEHGEVVVREALSEVELLDFPGVGTLEAFNTDGLRTLIRTMKIPMMKEKTMRYPGHADRMRMLREMGLFSNDPVEVDGVSVVPRRLTESLLFEKWRRPAHERELTVLRIIVEGEANDGSRKRYVHDLLDHTDPATGWTSMARTTGFPCAIMARAIADGRCSTAGILPLELVAPDDSLFDHMIAELGKRGVSFHERIENA
ncbi:MAG: saccharopine dehydrogenase NADP-binding domain-containing protein [Acidobacteria bacterium]|nr:saccharopine dehydrogenase NADP-binding domain-containing protein [Acidobacteriota bacterium]